MVHKRYHFCEYLSTMLKDASRTRIGRVEQGIKLGEGFGEAAFTGGRASEAGDPVGEGADPAVGSVAMLGKGSFERGELAARLRSGGGVAGAGEDRSQRGEGSAQLLNDGFGALEQIAQAEAGEFVEQVAGASRRRGGFRLGCATTGKALPEPPHRAAHLLSEQRQRRLTRDLVGAQRRFGSV